MIFIGYCANGQKRGNESIQPQLEVEVDVAMTVRGRDGKRMELRENVLAEFRNETFWSLLHWLRINLVEKDRLSL